MKNLNLVNLVTTTHLQDCLEERSQVVRRLVSWRSVTAPLIISNPGPDGHWSAEFLFPGNKGFKEIARGILRGMASEQGPFEFRLYAIGLDPKLRRQGIATQVALRLHERLAPDLPAGIQGSFTPDGWAFAVSMSQQYGWTVWGDKPKDAEFLPDPPAHLHNPPELVLDPPPWLKPLPSPRADA